jgi:hypothetical protein
MNNTVKNIMQFFNMKKGIYKYDKHGVYKINELRIYNNIYNINTSDILEISMSNKKYNIKIPIVYYDNIKEFINVLEENINNELNKDKDKLYKLFLMKNY